MREREPRLSGPTLKVLKLCLSAPRTERAGAEFARTCKLGSGTLYPLLNRLEESGWLESRWEEVEPREVGRPRRRLYRLTGVGQLKAQEAFAEFQLPQGGVAWAT